MSPSRRLLCVVLPLLLTGTPSGSHASADGSGDPVREVVSLTAREAVVDVTDGPVTVVVTAHLRGDSPIGRIQRPQLYLDDDYGPAGNAARPVAGPTATMRLVAGTPRDGIWRTRVELPRGYPETELYGLLLVRDDEGWTWHHTDESVVSVVDAAADPAPPRLRLVTPLPRAVADAATQRRLRVKVRVVDEGYGVDAVDINLDTVGEPSRQGGTTTLVAGDRRAGTWAASFPLRRSFSPEPGRYRVMVGITERALPWNAYWAGNEAAVADGKADAAWPDSHPGVVRVVGTR